MSDRLASTLGKILGVILIGWTVFRVIIYSVFLIVLGVGIYLQYRHTEALDRLLAEGITAGRVFTFVLARPDIPLLAAVLALVGILAGLPSIRWRGE